MEACFTLKQLGLLQVAKKNKNLRTCLYTMELSHTLGLSVSVQYTSKRRRGKALERTLHPQIHTVYQAPSQSPVLAVCICVSLWPVYPVTYVVVDSEILSCFIIHTDHMHY